jgi:ankyrin repeat protein
MTCVTYLSFNAFETGFCPMGEEFEARLQSHPLYNYAAQNWGHHARAASTEVEQLTLNFLKSEKTVSVSSQAMIASRDDSGYNQRVPRQMTGVHLAAYFGLKEAIVALLKNGHNLDCKDTYGQTPPWWGAEKGHEAVVKLLLEKGADSNSKDKYDWTPLSWAEKGREAVVELLEDGTDLESEEGTDLESKDEDRPTPLSWAVGNGHEAVMKLLLEKL